LSKKFENKVVFITGGSTGIGFSTAKRFAEEGAKVVIASSNVERGEAAIKQIKLSGSEALFIQTDVSQFDQIQKAIEKTIENYGRLDYAFNNAGTPGEMGPLHTGSEENWDNVLDVNLKGIWAAMKFEIEHMAQNGGGVIINNSSTAGGRGIAGLSVYNASKFGIHGLTKAAALEYAKAGVRVNIVMPGPIETNMIQGMQDYLVSMVPMEHTGEPDDIANAVLWLCSDEASFVTGVALPVDGGMLES
jgi:NAD(P)-dependent dehydrogenase (short-subunit alcohol dehydrogenase family)